jgi:predicted RNA-binding Zn-ribbon protein involved in translation (DUF1610 family)
MTAMSEVARKSLKAAVEDNSIAEHMEEYNGLCFNCGAWKYGDCEPDARNYKCDECGFYEVFGAEEALIYLL